ncbi:MAG: S1C family serine protease [Acidimicrobiales bacterium]|nr:S1C family serine protease [Acidimicrobiales bacterium]
MNGSATVFRRDGVLLTTRRLVLDGDEVVVDLGPLGNLPAQVMGTDAHTDVAVLTVDVPDLGQSARWSDEALDGPVSIAGLDGRGRRASIRGTVSATRVRERVPGGAAVDGMLRLDADVPVEMTGGALIDGRGAVVGLVNAMPFEDDDTHGGGQAIAAPIASVVAETLIGDDLTQHAWLGVEVAEVDAEGVAGSGRAGVVVKGLAADGPAAEADVEVGDAVVAVDGADVASTSDLIALLRQRRGGDIVTVDLVRDGTERRVEVTLGARADDD